MRTMGMAKFRPRGSKTPVRTSIKLGIYNYVVGMTTYTNPCGVWRYDKVGGLGEHVTCHML